MTDLGVTTSQPLKGFRIVDLTTSYAGPTATMMLAELGADVIKIERPGMGDEARSWGPPFVGEVSGWFASANRGKRSVVLDLRDPEDQLSLSGLLHTADVLVQSFNPTKLEGLGLEPETVRERFPNLVYCAISGFGFGGPDSEQPGYDLIAQARSGIMSVTGEAGGVPQRVSTALSDITTGVLAAFAVCAALVGRGKTGPGCFLDLSLLDSDLALMAPRLVSFLSGEAEPAPSGATDSVLAIYQTFPTLDGPIAVAIGNDAMWERFCEAIGLDELKDDARLKTNAGRRSHRHDLVGEISDMLSSRPSAHWLSALRSAAVPCSVVQGLAAVVADKQVQARDSLGWAATADGETVAAVRLPWRIDGARPEPLPVPGLDQHGAELRVEGQAREAAGRALG
jgi:crotonobetainyl-CoA:carnitine CoA-transferase CaiB-like acyl-CoA transferase